MLLAPAARADSTNSFSRSESVYPRTMRAMYDHENSVITPITTVSPGWMAPPRHPSLLTEHAATMPTAIRICGTASRMSAKRERIASVQRPA
jgi:hypothetical protein